tara:strand:+ start:799 stop:1074 length:276 start_codon:yes stop_codon:yes gene_type:complete
MKRLEFLKLDLISIPSLFLWKKANARYHLKYVCPKCPKCRREMRDVENKKECWWNSNWSKENYDIPKTFGVWNWISQYIFFKTNLSKYRKN